MFLFGPYSLQPLLKMFEKTFDFHSKYYLNSTLLFFTLSPTPISFGHPNTWSVHEMQPLQHILTIAAEAFFSDMIWPKTEKCQKLNGEWTSMCASKFRRISETAYRKSGISVDSRLWNSGQNGKTATSAKLIIGAMWRLNRCLHVASVDVTALLSHSLSIWLILLSNFFFAPTEKRNTCITDDRFNYFI